jgi:drug/metabolite transporter (DMT)-like permease
MSPALLGLVATFAWSLHDFIGRFSTRAIGQLPTTIGVMLSGALALTAVVFALGPQAAFSTTVLWIAALAGASYAVATLCLLTGYRIGSISVVSPLVGAYPALVVAWNVALGSRPSAYAWVAMAAVMIGTAVVSVAGIGHEEKGHIEQGRLGTLLWLSALSALGYAVSVTAGQAAAPLVGEIEASWIARSIAVLVLLPLLLRRDMRRPAPLRWWPALVAMGLADTLAMVCVFKAGEMPGAEIAAVAGSAFAGVVAVLGWLFLREPVTPVQWFGIALTIAGTAVLTLGW